MPAAGTRGREGWIPQRGSIGCRKAAQGIAAAAPVPPMSGAFGRTDTYEWWMREVDLASVLELSRGVVPARWNTVRTEVMLNVMLDALEHSVLKLGKQPSMLGALTSTLVAIASNKDGNPFEQAPRVRGWLYWRRPQGCGWLASSIAFWIAPEAFFVLPPEVRLGVLDRLPRTQVSIEADGISFASSVQALSRAMPKLTTPEIGAVRDWVGAAESGPLLDLWRADLLTGLVASQKDVDAAAQLRALAAGDSITAAHAEVFAGYVEAIAQAELGDLEQSVLEVANAISKQSVDPLRRGVALAFRRPAAERVRALLTRVVETPEPRYASTAALEVLREELGAQALTEKQGE